MLSLKKWIVMTFVLSLAMLPVEAYQTDKAESPLAKIKWTKGPSTASLKDIAEIRVPQGYQFAAGADTRKLLEAMGNPTSGDELGFLSPTSMVWFVVFEYDKTGYIKDDDKDKLDPDAMLKAIKAGTEEGNKRRKKMGAAPMNIIGWEQPPKYNPETHNLEWAIRAESEGSLVVNYNTRLLGRGGVMEVSLVVDPEKLADTMPAYQSVLTDYSFKQGERYAEYRPGDKVAKYGLAALVTGGAAVVAVKSGLLAYILLFAKKAWVLVVAAFAAVVNFFKRLVNGGGRKKSNLE
ncbi:MAG: hypothetical protein JWR26_3675 [Pedosphaera sp.]|nr:hypothetical protein [Pedosphaera sp.]